MQAARWGSRESMKNRETLIDTLKKLMQSRIEKWRQEELSESIYAISLYVFNEEDDPHRPVAVLGYNTQEQVERSLPLASDGQEARWNYAFWLQNEELCFGRGDTEELVRQWIAGQAVEDEGELAEAFEDVLAEAVRELHTSGVLRDRQGRDIPILIHGLEYYEHTARLNLEANLGALDRDFCRFCGLDQGGQDGEELRHCGTAEWTDNSSKCVGNNRTDMPKKFSCGERKTDFRYVIGVLLLFIGVASMVMMWQLYRSISARSGQTGAGPENMENFRQEDGATAEPTPEGEAFAAGPTPQGGESAPEIAQGEARAASEETASVVSEGDLAHQKADWQVFIHPDMPEALAEVLKQYERAMRAGVVPDALEYPTSEEKGTDKDGATRLNYVYDEVYAHWYYADEEERGAAICYSLADLTGDGVPELILGNSRHDIQIVYYCGEAGDVRFVETTPYYTMTLYGGGVIEYVSAGVYYTLNYLQFSAQEQDWRVVESLGAHWDFEHQRNVEPYRQMTADGESTESEPLSEEEFQEIIDRYTRKKVELQWFSLSSPDWHIPVASGEKYDLYLEGISTDLWMEAQGVRQLSFSVYDKEGELVQELTEISPYLPYMPEAGNAGDSDGAGERGILSHPGNFYWRDMNFDGEEDLMLLWMNAGHPRWRAYLWREEGVFREEPADRYDGVFGYCHIVEDGQYIDDIDPQWNGCSISRMQYDGELGYRCAGALEVVDCGEGGEALDESAWRYREYFYEGGECQGSTEEISRGEISELWSDLWE